MRLIVLAKLPVPGRAKTRLSPPCSLEQGAAVAESCLQDTLAAGLRATAFDRRVLVVERFGLSVPATIAHGYEVIDQRGEGLGQRISNAVADVGGPAVLVGMDTPQVDGPELDAAANALAEHDAVIGPAHDGGFWLLGLQRPHAGVCDGVPMSEPGTGRAQAERLVELGMRVHEVRAMLDIDTYDDALAIAEQYPNLRLADTISRIRGGLPGAPPDGSLAADRHGEQVSP